MSGFLITGQDTIEASQMAEIKLYKLNRLYSTISQINKTIVHIKDKDKLLSEACRIAIDYGKFRMAWIGLIDEQERVIKPKTFAGNEDGYLSAIRQISANDIPERRGPTGIALREGRYFVCDNFETNPTVKLWKHEALKRGYHSSIALPIKMFGKTIGAYTIYADVPGFFEQEEIDLLLEVSNDISFALETIDLEKTRKLADEKAKTLSAIVEHSPSMIIITDKNGKINFINDEFKSFMQYTEEEIIGKEPLVFKPKYHIGESYVTMWQTLLSGKVWKSELKNRKKDRTEFWENITIFPFIGSDDRISNYVIIVDDISEKRQFLEDLVAAKLRAEESDRLKSAFLANISHEIHTQMNTIMGFTELLKEHGHDSAEQMSYIYVIEESEERMLNLMNDIIDISRIEAGEVILSMSVTDVNAKLEHIYCFFKNEAKQKGLKMKIRKTLKAGDFLINTDPQKLDSILINLVKNAIKFTKQGYIEFGCRKDGENILFFVTDTGEGISLDDQKIIFKRFRQASASLNRDHEGAGLGLPIAKAYTEILGGKIWVVSVAGQGSSFYFTLPVNMPCSYR